MAKVVINRPGLLRALSGPVMKTVQKRAREISTREVEKSSRELMRQFLTHEITREIAAGPDLGMSSVLGGRGNLFSFLGFEEGENPIAELSAYLSRSIKISAINRVGGTYTLRIKVELPSMDEIEGFTELPWTTKSWVRAVEEGVSGLGQYLFSAHGFEASRSSTGMQAEKTISARSMSPQQYLSTIIESISKKLASDITTRIQV